MEAILETKKLSHIYSAGTPFERAALADVDFAAYPGEYLGIIGHTGSGKSTLIQHLNGLLKPTSGQVLFQGTDIWTDLKTTRRTRFQVGPQEHGPGREGGGPAGALGGLLCGPAGRPARPVPL